MFVGSLPDGCTVEALRDLFAARSLSWTSAVEPESGGYIEVQCDGAAAAAAAVALLEGLSWSGSRLLVLPMGEARVKLRAHRCGAGVEPARCREPV